MAEPTVRDTHAPLLAITTVDVSQTPHVYADVVDACRYCRAPVDEPHEHGCPWYAGYQAGCRVGRPDAETTVSEARRQTIAECLAVVMAEPELPGQMPCGIRAQCDLVGLEEYSRGLVRVTKQSIHAAIAAMGRQAAPGGERHA